MGCGGINPDSLIQLYSFYIQNGASDPVPSKSGTLGNSSFINGTTTLSLLVSIAPKPPAQTTMSVVGPAATVGTGYEPTEPLKSEAPVPLPETSAIGQPAGASNPGAKAPTAVGTAYEPPEPLKPEAPAPLPETSAIEQPAGASNAGAIAPATVETPTTASTTAGVPAATTITAVYMEPFWVSIDPFIEPGDQFENYTVSSTDPEVNDTAIWWDPPAIGFVGVAFPGPPQGNAKWFIHVTMRGAGGGAYHTFDIEVDVTGKSTQTAASPGSGSLVPGAPSFAASPAPAASGSFEPPSLLLPTEPCPTASPSDVTPAPDLATGTPGHADTTTYTVTVWKTVTSFYTVWPGSPGTTVVVPRGVAASEAEVDGGGLLTTTETATSDVGGGKTATVVSVRVVWSEVSAEVDTDGPLLIAAATSGTGLIEGGTTTTESIAAASPEAKPGGPTLSTAEDEGASQSAHARYIFYYTSGTAGKAGMGFLASVMLMVFCVVLGMLLLL